MLKLISIGILVHGFAHLVGFLVPWKLAKLDEAPYRTTLLGGKLDIGDSGIRLVGICWLLTAIAVGVAGVAMFFSFPWWYGYTLAVSAVSLLLCILGWPDSRFGVSINVVVLAYLVIGRSQGLV